MVEINSTLARLTLLPDLPNSGPSADRGFLHARPADRCESWRLEDPGLTARIAQAAASAGLDTNLAVVLTVERALIEAEFNLDSMSAMLELLDDSAERTRVTMQLAPATAGYLRALKPRITNSSPTPTTFKLPMRLSDRILRLGFRSLVRPELLRSGASWERAAVLSGQTMSEWALTTELSLR